MGQYRPNTDHLFSNQAVPVRAGEHLATTGKNCLEVQISALVTGEGSGAESSKGRSLASRLLAKKGGKHSEKLVFGSHAQSSGRRGSSLPSFEAKEPSASGTSYRYAYGGPHCPSVVIWFLRNTHIACVTS